MTRFLVRTSHALLIQSNELNKATLTYPKAPLNKTSQMQAGIRLSNVLLSNGRSNNLDAAI